MPEAALHATVTTILLLGGKWFTFALNLPLLAFNVNKYLKQQHKLDATEIFRTVTKHKQEAFIKMIFHLIIFFYYLYAMIMALVGES